MEIPGTEGLNVYADAKTEYTRQLTQFSLPAFTGYFLKLLDEIKASEVNPKKLLLTFQSSLKDIPEWNQEKVQKETGHIIKDINCDYYDDLLSAVFVAHTKVLSAIRLTTKQKKLHITIPKVDHFLHHTLIECARILWSNVYLFSPNGSDIERQKSLRQIEQLIQDGILQSVRSMLPVKNILKEYLKDDDEEEEKDEDELKEKEMKEKEVKDEEEEEEKLEKELKKEVKEEEEKLEKKLKKEAKEEMKEVKEVKEEETKEEIKEAKKEVKEVKEETNDEDEKPKAKKETPAVPTIEVDTEPFVKFSDSNTVFNYEGNTDEDAELFDILESKGEKIDDFEDLEKEEIEFETL